MRSPEAKAMPTVVRPSAGSGHRLEARAARPVGKNPAYREIPRARLQARRWDKIPPATPVSLGPPSLPLFAITAAAWLGLFAIASVVVLRYRRRLRAAEAATGDAVARGLARTQELQAVLDTAVSGIIVIDTAGRVESFNRGAEALFGYAAAEVIGQNVSMLMPSPDHDRHDGYLARYLETRDARVIGHGREVTGRRRDGSSVPLHLAVGEMTIGGVRKFTGLLHDLSARVEQEEQRRTSDARWQAVVQSAVDGIVVIDPQGLIEAFNPAAERLFGYTEAEVVGHNVSMLMPSPYREAHDGYLAHYLETGHRTIIGIGREVQGLRRDGTTFPLHLSVGEFAVGGARRFTGIVHDLTTRAETERRLREQTALACIGEMAAVLAHEVKNPLAGIRGAVQVIGGRLPAESTARRMIGEIIARIDSLSELMKDLLLFARPPKPQPRLTDLTRLVGATADLLRQDPALRDVSVHVEGGAAPLMADAGLMQIVFHNLLVNAAQAMSGRGRIVVSVAEADARWRVAVADTGPGIPIEHREKLFTPFFTTKARGSGLGLPTCRRVVEAHGGTIDVSCPPAGGTVVTVMLPAASDGGSRSDARA
jgi:two-component system sensor kinase FixL